jgi:phospholipase C
VLGGAAALGGLLGAEALSVGRASAAPITAKMAPTGARGLGPGGTLLRPTSRPFPHLAAGTDTMPQIEHVVVLMMENHSFDDHLGMLGRGDGLTLGPDGTPVNYNPSSRGYVRSYHLPNTQTPTPSGINQAWTTSHLCWDHGTNMGFADACGPASMGYLTAEDLPFYYSMAKHFPVGDRYFCSVMAQTYPNRRFLIAGTALGDVSTNATGITITKDAPNGTIFDRLNAHGITWKDYYPDVPTCALFLPVWEHNRTKTVGINTFFSDAKSGNLPQFSLVDPYVNYSEENGTMSIGEAYAARVMEAVMSAPTWPHTALFWVYDEHGGWYDHVPPKPAVRPDTVPPEITVPPNQPGTYDYTGFRVPCAVLSPYAKADYVSHVTHTHTSILKFVETKWNLPAMTFRDANASNMLDFFDFAAHPHFLEPPELAKPLNPFPPGPIPVGSGTTHKKTFHVIATAVPGDTLPPAQYFSKTPPKGADRLIAAHTKKALSEP